VNGLPCPRHTLRRFYENNAKVIATVPRELLTVLDYTERDSNKGIARCVCAAVCLPLSACRCLPAAVCLPLSACRCLPPAYCLPACRLLLACLPPTASLPAAYCCFCCSIFCTLLFHSAVVHVVQFAMAGLVRKRAPKLSPAVSYMFPPPAPSLLNLDPNRVKDHLAAIHNHDKEKVARIVEKKNLTLPPSLVQLINPREVPPEVRRGRGGYKCACCVRENVRMYVCCVCV
jgi:hypothetical protein